MFCSETFDFTKQRNSFLSMILLNDPRSALGQKCMVPLMNYVTNVNIVETSKFQKKRLIQSLTSGASTYFVFYLKQEILKAGNN